LIQFVPLYLINRAEDGASQAASPDLTRHVGCNYAGRKSEAQKNEVEYVGIDVGRHSVIGRLQEESRATTTTAATTATGADGFVDRKS